MADKQQSKPTTTNTKPVVPFIFDRADFGAPRAWKPSKPTDKTRDQITVALGTVAARIAGSPITFPMDVQLVFSDKLDVGRYSLRMPWASGPGGRGGAPLFVADDDSSAKQLQETFAGITERFLAEYAKRPADQRLDLDELSYDDAAALIKSSTNGVTVARKRN